jgi:hypothetical protein
MATDSVFPESYKDPQYAMLDAGTEQKLGLPSGLLSSVRTNGERSNHSQTNSENTFSVYQFTPATRKAILDKYGLDVALSPQNASEGAGLLLQEGLKRNGNDPAQAVGEYIGGTNRANWGKTTAAYIQRVTAALGRRATAGRDRWRAAAGHERPEQLRSRAGHAAADAGPEPARRGVPGLPGRPDEPGGVAAVRERRARRQDDAAARREPQGWAARYRWIGGRRRRAAAAAHRAAGLPGRPDDAAGDGRLRARRALWRLAAAGRRDRGRLFGPQNQPGHVGPLGRHGDGQPAPHADDRRATGLGRACRS